MWYTGRMAAITTPEQGRAMAARRKLKTRACAWPPCAVAFPTIGRGLYHSRSCEARAYRARKRAARPTP